MDAILQFFSAIVDAVGSIFGFIISCISDLVYLVQLTGKILLQIPVYFSWMPDELKVMIVSIFTVVVLYKVLGREG